MGAPAPPLAGADLLAGTDLLAGADPVGVRGAVRGRLVRGDGPARVLPWASNLICFSGLDLIGALLCRRPGMTGLTWFAVGTGDPAWDAAPPAPDRSRTALTAELARVALVPGRHVHYDAEAGAVRIRVTLGPGGIFGSLRELGLFGGDASARPGSGVLFNHKVHDRIDLGDADTLDREIALELGSGLVPGARDLIGLLLARQPGVAGLQYVAFGSDGRTGGPPPTALAAEAARLPLAPRAATYDRGTHAVTVTVQVGFADGPPAVAEAGLFGGSATAAAGSGLLVDRQVFPVVDRRKPTVLARRFVLSLVAGGTIAVPDVTTRPLAEARAALGAAGLVAGTVTVGAVAGKPAGTVVAQLPGAGAAVAEGTAVALTIAPDKLVAVPAVVGRPVVEATAAVTSLGLTVSLPVALEESDGPPGTVTAAEPPPGTLVPLGAEVRLTEAAARQRIVPDVRGRTPAAAAVVLAAAGFALGPEPYDTEATGTTAGTILAQDPPGGTLAPVNRVVVVTVAGPRTVVVPDLAGTTLDVAVTRLAAAAAAQLDQLGLPAEPAGLALGGRSARPAAQDEVEGTIVAQDPPAQGRASLYGTVAVTVAGPAQNVVPDLSGLDQGRAATALSSAGFALGAIAHRATEASAAPPGTVVAQDPAPGREWPPGGRVALTLAVALQVPVPDLVGLEQNAALEAIANRHLTPGRVTSAVSAGAARAGAVSEQDPPAGQLAPEGSAVDLTLALAVPDLAGMSLPDALAALAALGLQANTVEEESDLSPGRVIAQDPAAGAPAEPGQPVRVTVAKVRPVVVPDVRGRPLEDATAVMKAVGLDLQVGGQRESDGPEGTVLDTSPPAGSRVEPGATVSAILAVAPPKLVAVPEIRGLDARSASAACEQASLKMLVEGQRPAARVAPGTVLDQDPAAQTMVRTGTEVGVVTASADDSVAVPELRGMSLDEARAAADRSGVALAVGERRPGADRPDVVLSQDPLPGTRIPVGATVTVAASAAGLAVPDLVGSDVNLATSELADMGLQANVVRRFDTFNDPGTVTAQQPAPGTFLLRGSTVTITVAFNKGRTTDPGPFPRPPAQ